MGALDQFKQDIRLRTARIKAFIPFLVVLIHKNHRVFALRNGEVSFILMKSHNKRFCTISLRVWVRISMNAYEEICLVLIGNVGTFIKRKVTVILPGINNFYSWNVLFYVAAHLKGYV